MSPSSWTVVEPSLPALTFTYSFGPGTANALALSVDGGFVVVSPPCNAESALTELEARGPVRAIVAPNAFHSMGLKPWSERHPGVPVFAPSQSIARLHKQTKLTGIRPLAEAGSIVGQRVELVDMPHYKTGEALVRWPLGSGGWAWYMTDVAMNIPATPPGIFGLVMRWTRSAPGFRRNALAGLFMVKDKRALYAWLEREATERPPKLVLLCHGEHVRPADPVAEVRAAFA